MIFWRGFGNKKLASDEMLDGSLRWALDIRLTNMYSAYSLALVRLVGNADVCWIHIAVYAVHWLRRRTSFDDDCLVTERK